MHDGVGLAGAASPGWHVRRAVGILRRGGLIAYPTEAVFGLGCDPWNRGGVLRLLRIKGRSVDKGLILIAASLEQLYPWIGDIDDQVLARIASTWPGPVTWVLCARAGTPRWIRGGRWGIAVRVTAHPLAAALCRAFGAALVSTSANRAGQPPLRSMLAVRRHLGRDIDLIVPGTTGGARKPSEIRDACSGEILRRA
jgi:L-threonylcarbamoyladenylate synthase